MEEQRYWFEGVPEEECFWFLASWPAFSSGQAFEVTFKDEQGEGSSALTRPRRPR